MKNFKELAKEKNKKDFDDWKINQISNILLSKERLTEQYNFDMKLAKEKINIIEKLKCMPAKDQDVRCYSADKF